MRRPVELTTCFVPHPIHLSDSRVSLPHVRTLIVIASERCTAAARRADHDRNGTTSSPKVRICGAVVSQANGNVSMRIGAKRRGESGAWDPGMVGPAVPAGESARCDSPFSSREFTLSTTSGTGYRNVACRYIERARRPRSSQGTFLLRTIAGRRSTPGVRASRPLESPVQEGSAQRLTDRTLWPTNLSELLLPRTMVRTADPTQVPPPARTGLSPSA